MQSQTNEQALEAAIEKKLTGTTREEQQLAYSQGNLNEGSESYRSGNGYWMGKSHDFDKEYALDQTRFWHFLENTQAEELAKIQRASDWKLKILSRLDRMIQKYGVLHLLRKGLEVEDAHFTLLYVPPLASSGKEVRENFEKNEFSVTRQVAYSMTNPREELDMVIFINGLAIISIELKNPWTGQNARVHGVNQYKNQRDNKQPLLQFGRCLVHFAADPDEIFMATRLNGKETFFLPFNKGVNHGAGNPVNPFGHKTAYLWDEVLTRHSLANIIQHFVTLDGKASDPLAKRNLIFPRYHQLEVVRKILQDASENGIGKTYLIQHSAGSGKSNSITWAAYQLIECYPANETVRGNRGITQPLFDSVIVVTDRTILDKQLRDNIKEFSQVKNIVAPAFSSQELRSNLESGKKIIITTIQKFPFIINGIADLSDKRFAVIIDEAHSSQSGSAADNMNRAMGKKEAEENEEEQDSQDLILEAMRSRKMRGNASYLAFTATPKNTTLEKFGEKQADSTFKPFHLYSMKQAIQEGFILDVLSNYTTYKSFYELEKSIEDNPIFETKKAQKKLRAFVERHQQTIQTKAEIMTDHFVRNVVATKKLKGKGKAMVVTQNIETAILYFNAIQKILADKNVDFKAIIAFSGKKTVNGIEHTEDSLNSFAGKDIKDNFDKDEYKILVVANKFLTGFDQPKLCTMYIDKKLQGVLAVQALSRLNRSANSLGKRVEDLFILDFFNTTEDIKTAFDPFYTSTTLNGATDVGVLTELKTELDEVGVYEWEEVVTFTEKYFKEVDAQLLSPIIDKAAERFNTSLELTHEEKADFKIKAKQFVKIYGQVAAIMSFEKLAWEQLYWFLKFLIPKLLIKNPEDDQIDELLNNIDLSTYGLQRTKLGHAIELDETESTLAPQNSNPRGTHGGEKEEDPLDLIIRSFNEKWFQGWEATPEEQRVKFVSIARLVQEHANFKTHYVDNPDIQNRDLALMKMIGDAISKQRKNELEMYKLYSQDDAFRTALQDSIRRLVGL